MAEIQPPEGQTNGGGTLILNSYEPLGVGSKRQRRPSVRLGDIGGDPPYDSHHHHHHHRRNTHKPWKPNPFPKDPNPSGKPSKTRPLTNLTETLEEREGNNSIDGVATGSWKLKESSKKRASTKRARSNWVPRIDEGEGEGEERFSDDGYREFDVEISESPVHSMENLGVDDGLQHRRSFFKDRDHHDGVELSGPSDTDARDWKCDRNNNENGAGEDGVRVWLNGLGLGRYAPVFEVHEVDDEVLPMLTLEDLKDMGINAVGSRRKMYSAIQKLGKGFS